MITFNEVVGSNIALNVSSNSNAVPLKKMIGYCLAAVVTGAPTGSIKLQASNDPETNTINANGIPSPLPVNWADVASSSFTLSAAGETMWNVDAVYYNYVRVVYTDTSGGTSTATMKIIFNGKGE